EGCLDVLLVQGVEDAPRHDGTRTVVKGEIDGLFLGVGEDCLRAYGVCARVNGEGGECKDNEQQRIDFFLHIRSLGNFNKIIYFFPRTCYNTSWKAQAA